MKFLRNIWRKVFPAKNNYEGARRYSIERGFVWEEEPRDARLDLDSASRMELIRKSRHYKKNNGVVNRLSDVFRQYTVPITITPASLIDDNWNERAKEFWTEQSRYPDSTSSKCLSALMGEGANAFFIDGGFYIIKGFEKVKSVPGKPGLVPKIQLVEAHRLGTPPALAKQEGKTIFDGVEVDPKGRPIAYWFRESAQDEERFTRRAANGPYGTGVIPCFESTRIGSLHGEPLCAPVLNDIQDLVELEKLEMLAAKDAASKSFLIKNRGGEAITDEQAIRNASTSDARRESVEATTQDSQGNDVTETRRRVLKQVLGGKTEFLETDEDLIQVVSNRPTVTQQWYWEYLTSKICVGSGMSKQLVFPFSIQGTVVRGDLDIAAAFFRSYSEVQAEAWRGVYLFFLQWGVRNDKRLVDPPADWKRSDSRPPRAPNVDVGRNSEAMLRELEAGTRTFSGVYAELGQDWKTMLRQKAFEAKFIKSLAKELDLEVSEISTAQQDKSERINAEGLGRAMSAQPPRKEKDEVDD